MRHVLSFSTFISKRSSQATLQDERNSDAQSFKQLPMQFISSNIDIVSSKHTAKIVDFVGDISKDKCNATLTRNPLLSNGKMQTIYSSMTLRKRDKHSNIEYEREPITMDDGGLVSLDWYPDRPSANTLNIPIVIALPGSMGSSSGYHIRCLAKTLCNKSGIPECRLVVLNHRGFGRTPLVTAKVPAFHYTGDLHETVQFLLNQFPGCMLGAIGYSMGANILTKYLGEQGNRSKLSAAVTICCPFDVPKLYNTLGQPTFFNTRLLQPSLTSKAAWFVKTHHDVIQSGPRKYDLRKLFNAQSVAQVDTLMTAPISGFASCEQYYRESSCGPYVHNITTPLLAINSKDDPMVPVDAIPVESFKDNPNLALILTSHGGHLGFLTGLSPRIWYIDPAIRFFSNFLVC